MLNEKISTKEILVIGKIKDIIRISIDDSRIVITSSPNLKLENCYTDRRDRYACVIGLNYYKFETDVIIISLILIALQ